MSIPSTINILGTTFTVKVENIAEEAGLTETWKRQITIDSGLTPEAQVETFYHELVHAILEQTGVAHALDDKQNEAVAQGLGMALAMVMSTNNLPAYVFKESE